MDDCHQIETQHGQDQAPLDWVATQPVPIPGQTLGADTVAAHDQVRLLEVTISADLSLDRHVSVVSATSFHSLRQLRRVRHSLDIESTTTLVHAFVTSRLDYCNILLAGSPKTVIDKLQRVMNAAA